MVAPVYCFLVVVLAGAQAFQLDTRDLQLQQMMQIFSDEMKALKMEVEDMRKTVMTADGGLAGNDVDDVPRNKRQISCEDDGRDGAPGRDGAAGRDGQPGPQGPIGPKGDIGPEGPPGEQGERGADGSGGGSVYIRWGRATCPNDTDTSLIYDGIAGGTLNTQSGGGANYVCLPKDPEWGVFTNGNQFTAYMYGAEYELANGNNPFQGASLHDHDVPCAICHVASRGSKLMIPARLSCPSGWTREYKGYLMTEAHSHNRSEFVCVDGEPETRPGGHLNHNGALFYPVEADCGSLPCPNYVQGRELTCVVCTQ
uniref:Short-chain collagen C4-like n=1 Tax=Branchiostoma floridae TaxID=7739 RepID=C3YXL4_BRAFL|eukprot:XP_002598811.1 hypothetical protein BRAFLDRAFT_74512 [Branchiostoma floridae]